MFQLTRRNLAALSSPINIVNTDYQTGLANVVVPTGRFLITFIAPPWGGAVSTISGLDLRRTASPIAEIIDVLVHRFGVLLGTRGWMP